ncbi:ImmA/IrrE family metallo-endopeptidase [Hymenobacter rubripertinctus]|uniref:ImmA/IrrE family metallo-endopeptidase n=1 Tax=Hymenobacter rubripertinctus TaxID=2029981 RepID=A0A418QNU1_9BACT|nr:ImmA/IrrE family metallo-endopeptidase [Hymenobacter rubripertinctus]RIY06886.1 ImmA/IrrE family metallo-endopeptidase [Hymenobacter rubripertinctus]
MSPKFPPRFKAKAEITSLDLRRQLGLTAAAACPAKLATGHHGVLLAAADAFNDSIVDALLDEFPDHLRMRQQLRWIANDTIEFSAIVAIVRGCKMILYNANNSPARQQSDIMHELAHILCEHKGDCLQLNSDISLRVHNAGHEQEAKWLGAALQIPEQGIFEHVRAGRSSEEIAQIYGASLPMVIYRRRILAIDRRISYLKQVR